MLIWTLGIKLSEILNDIHAFSFKKNHLKMSSVKWRQSHLGFRWIPPQKTVMRKACLCHDIFIRYSCTTFYISIFHNNIIVTDKENHLDPRWRNQMEAVSALLALCAGNSPVAGEFPSQRSVTRSFDVLFDLHLNKSLSKKSWGWWFEEPSRSLWRHCNVSRQC